VVASGVGFGVLGVFGKAALRAGISSGENLSLRFLISAVALFLLNPRALRLDGKTIARCAFLGIAGYAVFSSLYFAALEGLSASLTVLLLYTYPVIVTVIARLVLKQPLHRRNAIALPVVMCGLVFLVSADLSAKDPRYVVFGIGAAVLYSVYILVSSRVLAAGTSPIASVAWIQLFAGLALASLHLHDAGRVATIVRAGWPVLLGMALLCTAMPMVLFISGLQKLTSAEVSLLSTTEPVTGVALATILLGERLAPLQWLGAAVIVGALIYVAGGRKALVAPVAALALVFIAPDSQARPAALKLEKTFGLQLDGGYETISFEDVTPAVNLDGFGGSAMGSIETWLAGRRGQLDAEAGLHFSALSGDNDAASLSLTLVSLALALAPTIDVLDGYRIGGVIGYDLGLYGSSTYESKLLGATKSPLTRSSRLTLGGRLLFELKPQRYVGGDIAYLSGSYRVKEAQSGVDYSGLSLRFVFDYLL
jgi:drug/metabolite transporter (DMT)-like permease